MHLQVPEVIATAPAAVEPRARATVADHGVAVVLSLLAMAAVAAGGAAECALVF